MWNFNFAKIFFSYIFKFDYLRNLKTYSKTVYKLFVGLHRQIINMFYENRTRFEKMTPIQNFWAKSTFLWKKKGDKKKLVPRRNHKPLNRDPLRFSKKWKKKFKKFHLAKIVKKGLSPKILNFTFSNGTISGTLRDSPKSKACVFRALLVDYKFNKKNTTNTRMKE